ncbi:MAG: CsiV family protein [Pseudomonadales bacterium]
MKRPAHKAIWQRIVPALISMAMAGLASAETAALSGVVIPELSGDESTPVVTPAPARRPETALAEPRLRGDWIGFEIIIFERPQAGYVVQGETLRLAVPAPLPANLTSRNRIRTDGAVLYLNAEGASETAVPECRWIPGAATGSTPDPLRELFASPPRQEAVDAVFPPQPDALAAPAASATPPALTDEAAATPGALPAIEPTPDPRAVLQEALDAYEAELNEQSLHWLNPDARRLGNAASRLAASGDYRVLLHEAWIQNLADRDAPAVLLMPDAEVALIGSARIVRDRGPRLRLDLAFRGVDAPADDAGFLILSDERRVTRATYYIDHPRLGVILRATEVGIPNPLKDAFAALTDPQPAPDPAVPVPIPSPTP